MNTNLKKILLILVIILVLALIAFLVYNFFIKKPSDGTTAGGGGQFPAGGGGAGGAGAGGGADGGGVNPSPTLKIKAISTEKVLSPTLSADKTKAIFYSQYNGNVWQVAYDGTGLTRISSAVLDNLAQIIWSPDKKKVISIYKDEEENIGKYSYNYTTGKATSLGAYLGDIAWSFDSNKIAYQYTNDITNQNNISTANADGTNWKNVLDTRLKNLNIDWVGSQIAFWEKPSGLAPSSLFLLNPLNKSLDKILSNIYGLSLKWSPSGNKILYSKTNAEGKNIGLYTASKDGSGEAGVSISTFVEKCVWSQDNRTIFCAIPKNISADSTLPDDFYKGVFVGDDDFVKINLDTGEKTNLLEDWEKGDEAYDAMNLFLSPLEDYLFFVNKKDGLLYSIEL